MDHDCNAVHGPLCYLRHHRVNCIVYPRTYSRMAGLMDWEVESLGRQESFFGIYVAVEENAVNGDCEETGK